LTIRLLLPRGERDAEVVVKVTAVPFLFCGSSFWMRTTAATTPIQATLMTPSASSITINPMLEPT
jgi:hypothetical protein